MPGRFENVAILSLAAHCDFALRPIDLERMLAVNHARFRAVRPLRQIGHVLFDRQRTVPTLSPKAICRRHEIIGVLRGLKFEVRTISRNGWFIP